MLPLLLTACARAEGALAPTGVAADVPTTDYSDQVEQSYLPDVDAASLEPIINYVDGLNLANKGWEKALSDDAALAKGLNVHEGKIYYEAVAKAHNL